MGTIIFIPRSLPDCYPTAMGHIDIISKSLIQTLVKDMATYLLGLEIVHLEEAATERQRIELRMADVVMLAETAAGERFILHIEMQNSNEADMGLRMLRYYTDIALAHPELPVRQYCIYTGKEPLTMRPELRGHDWLYRYTLIDMHRLDCSRFLQQDNPDALVMALLCDFKGRDEEEILRELIERLIAMTGSQPQRLRNYLKMMETLSANRGLTDIFKTVEAKMLREIEIEKLPSYQIGLEQGLEQGVALGDQRTERKMIHQAHKAGMSVTAIAAMFELTLDEVEEIVAGQD